MDVEETNSGLKKKGDIEDVADFARELEDYLKDDVEDDSIEEFDEWRPREDDDKETIERKTVKSASIPETEPEKNSEGVKKDLNKAGKSAKEAGKKIGKGQNPEEEVKKTSKRFFRPLYSNSIKFIRGLEESIYSNLMVKMNPYFFDARDFSANLSEDRKGQYTMDVNVVDDNCRENLKENFSDE